MFEKNAVGIDISRWQERVDFDVLASAGLDFVILKCGGSETGELYTDQTYHNRVQQAYDQKIPVIAAYWFVGARYWLQRQHTIPGVENLEDEKHPVLQYLINVVRNTAIDALFFDIEDASEWSGRTTAAWHAFYIRDLVERIRRQQQSGKLRKFKMGVYSRREWIDTKAKDLDIWLGTQPDLLIWTANWLSGNQTALPFNQIVSKRPLSGHQPRSFGWSQQRAKTWHIWQWAGDVGHGYRSTSGVTKADGKPSGLDLDLYNGTRDEMLKDLGKVMVQPPPPVPPQPEPEKPPVIDLSGIEKQLTDIQRMTEEIRKHFA